MMSKVFGVKPGSSAQSDQVLRSGNKSPTPDSDMGNVLAVSDASIKSPQILPPAPTSILSPGKVVFSDEADKNIDGLPSNLEFNRSTDWSSNGDNNQINNEVEEEREGNTGEPNSGQQQEIEDQIDMLKFFEDMVLGEVGMEEDMVDMSVFAQADENGKFDLIMVALNKLNAKYQKRNKKIDLALIEQDNGIFPRLQQNESTTDTHDTTIIDFQVKVTKLEDEVSQLKGIIQVQDRQISALKHEVTKLKTRSMKKNIVVTGIEGDDQGEDCKEKAKSFLNVQLKCKTESSEIKNVHRIGIESSGKPRPMVVKCGDKLRRDVFTYTKNLHKKKNTQGDRYFVDPQMPEELIAEKRALAAKVRRLKRINKTCEPQQRAKIDIKNKKLFVNNVQQKCKYMAPSVTEMLNIDKKDMKRVMALPLHESMMKAERGSLFCAYAKKVTSESEVRDCYMKVKYWHPEADHVIMATNVGNDLQSVDDGEWNAGIKLEHLLEQRDETNVAVFVAREYGNAKIGPKRFQLIQEVAEKALNKV